MDQEAAHTTVTRLRAHAQPKDLCHSNIASLQPRIGFVSQNGVRRQPTWQIGFVSQKRRSASANPADWLRFAKTEGRPQPTLQIGFVSQNGVRRQPIQQIGFVSQKRRSASANPADWLRFAKTEGRPQANPGNLASRFHACPIHKLNKLSCLETSSKVWWSLCIGNHTCKMGVFFEKGDAPEYL